MRALNWAPLVTVGYLTVFVIAGIGVATLLEWRQERRRTRALLNRSSVPDPKVANWDEIKAAIEDGYCVTEDMVPPGPWPDWAILGAWHCCQPEHRHETREGAAFCDEMIKQEQLA